jgi:hypothetical protein
VAGGTWCASLLTFLYDFCYVCLNRGSSLLRIEVLFFAREGIGRSGEGSGSGSSTRPSRGDFQSSSFFSKPRRVRAFVSTATSGFAGSGLAEHLGPALLIYYKMS